MSYQLIRKIIAPTLLVISFVSVTLAQGTKTGDISLQAAQVTEFEVNGLKVLVKRRSSSPTVAAGLFIRGGARNINEKNAGIESLMLNSAIEASKKYPKQTVRREVVGSGSGIGATAASDYSVVSLVATRPNFDRIWDIFADVMLNPAFAAEDIERNRAATLTGLREIETNPEGALAVAIERNIYAGHPYGNDVNGTVSTVSALKAADLIAYHKKVMQTSQLLLVFVGDLDAEDLKARIAASFGKLPRGDYKEQPFPQFDFSKPTVDIVARPNIPTNYVEGVFNAPAANNADYYPMQVAMAILGQLIFEEVRTKRQLSYAPDAEIHKFAANTASISVSSVNADQSVQVMLEQVNFMRTKYLTDEIVSDVAGNFLRRYYLDQETSPAQVGELARYELTGGGWRNTYDFLKRVSEVKSADVNAVSNKYMKNIRFVVVGNPKAINQSIFLQK